MRIGAGAKPPFASDPRLERRSLESYSRDIQSIRSSQRQRLRILARCLPAILWVLLPMASQAAASGGASTNGVIVLAIEGEKEKFQIQRAGGPEWDPGYVGQRLNPNDSGRLGPATRATVRLSDLTVMRLAENSRFTVHPPSGESESFGVSLWHGLLYLFHRDAPGSTRINSRTASAATRGTEFIVESDENTGRFSLAVIAGEGELSNEAGRAIVKPGERASADPGVAPRMTAKVEANALIQWVLYYPGVVAVEDLGLTDADTQRLSTSLAAYRAGDLPEAFRAYPSNPAAAAGASDAEKVYRAALLASLGQVNAAAAMLPSDATASPGLRAASAALRSVIKAVSRPELVAIVSTETNRLASEWMAESYERQSARQLESARLAALLATIAAPQFGFAWARLAELEIGFGRFTEAQAALDRALSLSPRNAQAHALRGFMAIRRFALSEARAAFDEAIRLDGALANAWLGRGLLRIRSGDRAGGREDMQIAASLEPQRGVLRSYLAKAWQESRELDHARTELDLAKELDPQDPTAWLYSSLVNLNQNRLNQAVRDLQRSQALNDNRAIYRSRFLLDQDLAVRGANLAGAYESVGLRDVALAEAGRSIASDYANYSAHLFLADTYNLLRDPHGILLRYETPWLSEYLLANLLSPAAAGTLSQTLGEQDFARFFVRGGIGLVSATDYLSRGDWTESAAQYGRFNRMSYAVETSFRSERGQRPNEDITSTFVDAQFKQELSPQDSVYLQAIYYSADQGDLTPYYSPTNGVPGLRVLERQEPLLIGGYHREWNPGSHTLFLASRLTDAMSVRNPAAGPVTIANAGGLPLAIPTVVDAAYRSRLEIYTAEIQHILERDAHTWVAGLRAQTGQINARNEFVSPAVLSTFPIPLTPGPSTVTEVGGDFSRFGGYLYDHWRMGRSFTLIAGLGYDHLRYPLNYRLAPLQAGEQNRDMLAPKLGFVWNPQPSTTLRGAVSRSLAGVSLDQSFQLEPTQIAGFNQAFRSLIPESLANANSGAEMRMAMLAVDQRIGSNTWVGVSGAWLTSELERLSGSFGLVPAFTNSSLSERLNYQERSIGGYAYHLLGDEWSLGARYRLTHSEIEAAHPDLPSTTFVTPPFSPPASSALLHSARLFVQFQHPSGFFGLGEAIWHRQSNRNYVPDLPGDDFWQLNVHAGYRWPNRRAEIRVGLLNLTDQDYRLNPLSETETLPRHRTLAVSLRLNF
ncbi:MAG: TonB-dependent receptor [Verrucomicrobia bacterium]|nr:TonB-dependent receptor [Verrucomicrobiota bacterium]